MKIGKLKKKGGKRKVSIDSIVIIRVKFRNVSRHRERPRRLIIHSDVE